MALDMREKIEGVQFSGELFFLSNFYANEPIIAGGVGWMTGEHLFQAHKTIIQAEQRLVHASVTPSQAKYRGRREVTLRPDWDSIRKQVMQFVLLSKFPGGSDLAERLLEVPDEEITEINIWHDNYWGKCSCTSCYGGTDWLGQLLIARKKSLIAAGLG